MIGVQDQNILLKTTAATLNILCKEMTSYRAVLKRSWIWCMCVYLCMCVFVGRIRYRAVLDTTFYFSSNSFCHLPDINYIHSVVPIFEGWIELQNTMKRVSWVILEKKPESSFFPPKS